MSKLIRLGYALPSGEPVDIPLLNMVVTGQTQQAGKTTAMEALIDRAGVRAVTFVTKRGEQSFRNAHRIPPYFRERADWVFVSSLIDATMREKNKMIRAWLMKVCRGTRTLADVLDNVRAAKGKARGFAESIYTEIEGYLDLVVPQLERLPAAHTLTLSPGVNAIDLADYTVELQSLVIRSVMEHVHQHERDIVTVIPEAWEFVPQGRNTPVTVAAREILRKGSGIGNYLWFDSQDLRGIDKEFVGQCPVVLMGVQREANEVKRSLANLHGSKKPKAEDVAHLGVGQFFACWAGQLPKVYVRPAWMSAADARVIAMGGIVPPPPARSEKPTVKTEPKSEPHKDETMSREAEKKLDKLIELMSRQQQPPPPPPPPPETRTPSPDGSPPILTAFEENALYDRFKARLVAEAPSIIRVLSSRPELRVESERKSFEYDAATGMGGLAKLVAEGWFDEPRSGHAAYTELRRLGYKIAKPSVYDWARKLAGQGFLTIEGDGFRAVEGLKRSIVEK